MDDRVSLQINRPRGTRSAMAIKNISLDKLYKRLITVLARDIAHLMLVSREGKLSKDESASLATYLKLVRTLQDDEKTLLESLSTEELEKVVEKGNK